MLFRLEMIVISSLIVRSPSHGGHFGAADHLFGGAKVAKKIGRIGPKMLANFTYTPEK